MIIIFYRFAFNISPTDNNDGPITLKTIVAKSFLRFFIVCSTAYVALAIHAHRSTTEEHMFNKIYAHDVYHGVRVNE